MFEAVMLLSMAALLYALDEHLEKKRTKKLIEMLRRFFNKLGFYQPLSHKPLNYRNG
ncbi:MAG: hypothetical protein FWC15_00495 [Fibromonadales bacterium]|nr:hypothetical protein [Fibromonadales bacterium]